MLIRVEAEWSVKIPIDLGIGPLELDVTFLYLRGTDGILLVHF